MVEVREKLDTTLGGALPREQARVRELLVAYRGIGPSGAFGAMMIERALRAADVAVMSGDPVEIIKAHLVLRDLK